MLNKLLSDKTKISYMDFLTVSTLSIICNTSYFPKIFFYLNIAFHFHIHLFMTDHSVELIYGEAGSYSTNLLSLKTFFLFHAVNSQFFFNINSFM